MTKMYLITNSSLCGISCNSDISVAYRAVLYRNQVSCVGGGACVFPWFLCIFFGLLDQFGWQSPFLVAHFGWLTSEKWLPKSQIGWEHVPTVPIFLEPCGQVTL